MTADDRPTPGRAAPPRSRAQVAILAAIALGTLVIVAVLAMTLVSGEGDDAVAPATPGPRSTAPIDEVFGTAPIPEGDYEAFCAEMARASEDFPLDGDQLDTVRQALEAYDVDQLIAVSPEGLRPALTTLRDERAAVLDALEQVDRADELTAADLPAGFLDAFGLVLRTAGQECPPVG